MAFLLGRFIRGDLTTEATFALRQALQRNLFRGEDLVVALGLTQADRARARDSALRRADAMLAGESAASPWARAGRLAIELRRFEQRIKPRLLAGRPVKLSPLHAALADALLIGAPPITSQRRLFDLLRD